LNQYEAMFLFDPTFGASFEACEGEIRRLMERVGAEIVFCRRWDERRLAYKIKGRKRGVYVLVYFKAGPTRIGQLHRDVEISENVLRALVLRADAVTPEMMERAAALRSEAREGAPGGGEESEGERSGGFRRGRREGGGDRGSGGGRGDGPGRERGDGPGRERGDGAGRERGEAPPVASREAPEAVPGAADEQA